MENQKQNEETKSNGIELLENVIKSNERNIASNIENLQSKAELRADIEDLVLAIGQMQLYFAAVNEFHNETLKFYKLEQSKRVEFLAKLPTKIETVLSQETIDFYENLEKRMKRENYLEWICNFYFRDFYFDFFHQFRNKLVQRKHKIKK